MILNLLIVLVILSGVYALGGWKSVGIGVLVYLIFAVWMRGRREQRKWPFSGRYEPGRHDPFSRP